MAKTKKKSSFSLRKVLIVMLFLANLIPAIGLIFSFTAQFLPPTWFNFGAFCGLGFIYLLALNACFVIAWLPIKYPFSLISLSLILLNINNIDKHFQLKFVAVPPTCINCIKVMSYNVKLFGLYDTDNKREQLKKRDQILTFINEEQPDILCLQEYFYDKSGELNFSTTDTLEAILKLKAKHYLFEEFSKQSRKYSFGLATFSKQKVVGKGVVEMPDSTLIAIYIDFKNKNDTIRVYNCHLASIYFDFDDYETTRELIDKGLNNSKWQKDTKVIYEKITRAFINRRFQTTVFQEHINNCNHKVIVCGDFNDSPASFAYNKIASNLKDSFRESGHGVGLTYSGKIIPNFRIDYILHDKAFRSYGHTVATSQTVSDHYPIYTTISLLKN